MIRFILLYLFFFISPILATTSLQPLQDSADKLEQSLWFNKGVLELKNKNYDEAIYLFNKTKSFTKIPSLLNIAIAKYNQNKKIDSKILFEKLISKQVLEEDIYAYLSSNIYLYKITLNKQYLKNITNQFSYIIDGSDRDRKVLIDTYIQLEDFKKAELIIDRNDSIDKFKKAILALINNNLYEAKTNLELYKKTLYDKKTKQDIDWFLLYIDLKLGNMDKIASHMEHLKQYQGTYFSNDKFNLYLDINLNRYDSQYYYKKIQKLDIDTKIALLFYFTSYKFSDDAQTQYSIANSFFLLNNEMLDNFDKMTAYNKLLLKYVQDDPYILRAKLEKFKHKDKKSYMYFNLGLSYANIGEYGKALEQFKIASNLKPGDKLYALCTLLCAKQTNKTFKGQKQLQATVAKGANDDAIKAKLLNKLLLKNSTLSKGELYGIDDDRLGEYISFLACNSDCLKLSFFDDTTDDIKNLLYLNANRSKEKFINISNIQDNIKRPNNLDEKYPVVDKLYSNYMRSVGLTHKLDNNSINYIKKFAKKIEKYDIQSLDGLYMLAASSILRKDSEDAYITISLINTLYKDNNSSFLIGLRYLKSKDFDRSLERFKAPFSHQYIDFKLTGLVDLIKGL